jgi:hypothetical protein
MYRGQNDNISGILALTNLALTRDAPLHRMTAHQSNTTVSSGRPKCVLSLEHSSQYHYLCLPEGICIDDSDTTREGCISEAYFNTVQSRVLELQCHAACDEGALERGPCCSRLARLFAAPNIPDACYWLLRNTRIFMLLSRSRSNLLKLSRMPTVLPCLLFILGHI